MRLALKIDVDTFLGTKNGVPRLRQILGRLGVEASFFFSLGEDQMGRSIFRIFQSGFLKKCVSSGVARNYPLRSLMYGLLLPAPVIYKRCASAIRVVAEDGFECGVHCWNHYQWQNFLSKMSAKEVAENFDKSRAILSDITGFSVDSCASAGWQVSVDYLNLEDSRRLLYASDCRGKAPFLPKFGGRVFKTLQIPTTLPTLDEILCQCDIGDVADLLEARICSADTSVMTIHAELEGGDYKDWFEKFLLRLKSKGVEFISLRDYARELLKGDSLPVREVLMSKFGNRGGLLAVEKDL